MLFLAGAEESSVMISLIRTILMDLCNVVYKLIIVMYDLFMAIGSATLLNSEQIQIIYNRVGLILGIVMIFRLMFSFIQYMIDPDKISDKEGGVGSLIKKVIVVILALGLTDWVFIKAFEIQETILEENTIGKIVVGTPDSGDDIKNFGRLFSYNLFIYFYHLSPEIEESSLSTIDNQGCGETYFNEELPYYVYNYGDFEYAHKCLNKDGKVSDDSLLAGNKVYYASFDGLEALLIGGVVLWVLLMYTITLAVRVVKLAFLRIIAPIPILSYIAPKKETAFQKWIKQCVTTYLDLFIRLAIIYFCMLLISIIFASDDVAINASTYLSPSSSLYKWFNIILILGILIFAKKIPEILGEIFPSLGGKGGLDFGFGLKSRTDFLGKGALKRATGAAIGAGAIGALGGLQGAFRREKNADGELVKPNMKKKAANILAGAATGMGRGIYHGMHGGKIGANVGKAFRGQAAASASTNKYIAAGGSDFSSRLKSSVARELGLPTAYDRLVAEVSALEAKQKKNSELNKTLDSAASSFDKVTDRLSSKITSDDTKTVISEQNTPLALQHWRQSGFINQDNRLILGHTTKTDANGNTIMEPILGESVIGKKFSDVDNIIEGQAKIAENSVKEYNQRKINASEQKTQIADKISANNDRMRQINQGSEEYERLKMENVDLNNQMTNLDAQIMRYDNELMKAEEERRAINVTSAVKKLKEGATIELLVGNYDDSVASEDLTTFIKRSEGAKSALDVTVNSLSSSTNPDDIIKKNEYEKASESIRELSEALQKIKSDSSYQTDATKLANLINELKNKEAIKNAVNFDAELDDKGNHETEQLKVDTIFDICDTLQSYQKKLSRYGDRYDIKLASAIKEKQEAKEMAREKVADEFRIGGKN